MKTTALRGFIICTFMVGIAIYTGELSIASIRRCFSKLGLNSVPILISRGLLSKDAHVAINLH